MANSTVNARPKSVRCTRTLWWSKHVGVSVQKKHGTKEAMKLTWLLPEVQQIARFQNRVFFLCVWRLKEAFCLKALAFASPDSGMCGEVLEACGC